jgi:CcmD family protein
MKKTIAILYLFLIAINTSMLLAADVKDLIRGNAKFNSVIIVLTIIFGGIVFFLFRMDKRLAKLEKQKENKQ